jgi:hypothetical protein
LRIATGGTGMLPEGALHPDLVRRLADEAGKIAQRVLTICIRALDYLPPVDVTFGDYIRGLITADHDLAPDDTRNYRIALIGAFRNRGIYPRDVRTQSVESLRWRPPDDAEQGLLQALLPPLAVLRVIADAHEFAGGDRFGEQGWQAMTAPRDLGASQMIDVPAMSEQLLQAYRHAAARRRGLDDSLERASRSGGALPEGRRRREEHLRERQFAWFLHQCLYTQARREIAPGDRERVTRELGIDLFNDNLKFEVHAVRPATRVRPDGRTKTELLVLITQRAMRDLAVASEWSDRPDLRYRFRGGVTLLIDPETGAIRYAISKSIYARGRQARQEEFLTDRLEREGLHARGRYSVWQAGEAAAPQEPFRMLHRGELWEPW